jgi:hypothetical protein
MKMLNIVVNVRTQTGFSIELPGRSSIQRPGPGLG